MMKEIAKCDKKQKKKKSVEKHAFSLYCKSGTGYM